MYKVGDKVETGLGVGVIKYIDNFEPSEYEAWVSINGMPEMSFEQKYLKPYITAHDKLIAMGWKYREDEKSYNKNESDWIEISKNGYAIYHIIAMGETHPYLIDLHLSRILTQLLEEVKGE